MSELTYIDLKQCILDDNAGVADEVRRLTEQKHILLWNVMSSPGAGKTTFLIEVIRCMKDTLRFGVVEGDIESTVDAEKMQALGVPTVQLRTGGDCHLDASMVMKALQSLPLDELDVVVIENIGNLVCPAEFDLGADLPSMLLSVPEGDDKAIKYPLMFSVCQALVVTKTDTLELFDFDMEALQRNVHRLNADMRIFPLSAKRGDGMEAFCTFLQQRVETKTKNKN